MTRDQTKDTTVWVCSLCSWRIMRMTKDQASGDLEAHAHERKHGLFNGSAAMRMVRGRREKR